MLSAANIRQFQQEAAARAARAKQQPITVFSAESAEADLRGCPNLGTYLAKGWKRCVDIHDAEPESRFESLCKQVVESFTERARNGSRTWAGHTGRDEDFRFFVDKSGFGDRREPALGLDEVVENLEHALAVLAKSDRKYVLGLGIVEEGQFQCYVGLFIREITQPKTKPADWRARQKREGIDASTLALGVTAATALLGSE